MGDLFQGFDPSRYDEEARRQWGTSDAFVESEKRTKGSLYEDAYAALKAGKSPADKAVMDIAERHRLSIDRWFYPCSHRMHRGLASMYEADDRFRQCIDTHGEGLTSFLAKAIRENAAQQIGPV